jgi:hypothetical protein
MAFEMHTVEVPSGLDGFSRSDRAIIGSVAIPYAAAAIGAASTATVTFSEPLQLPYDVFFAPTADVTAFLVSQTPLSFTVQIQNRLNATVATAAGTIGALIVN